MAWKPRIEDPSNIWPLVKKSMSTVLAGTLKCCMTPGRSQNRTSTNLTSSALMKSRTSSAELNTMNLLVRGKGGLERQPWGVVTTLGSGGFPSVTLMFRRCNAAQRIKR